MVAASTATRTGWIGSTTGSPVSRGSLTKSVYQNHGTELAGWVDMSKPLVPDDLWEIIEPLLPPVPPNPKGGRPRVPDRRCLTGIIFVLKTGLPWEYLPQESGCGSGMTCWRRLRDWQAAGVWERLHRELLDRLGDAGHILRTSADGPEKCVLSGIVSNAKL